MAPSEISAIVSLLSASLAWVAFRFTRHDKRVAGYESTRRALSALKQDLGVVADWAAPYKRLTLKEYETYEEGQHFKSWRRPHRTIFKFNYDAIRGIRQNPPTANFDEELLSDLSLLDHSITNLFSLVDRYERLVQGDVPLVRQVILKVQREESGLPVTFTQDEQDLLKLSFGLNYQLHTKGIGAEEEADKAFPGLHWAHKKTQESVNRVERNLRKPPFFSYEHRIFIVGDVVATAFLCLAVWLIGSAYCQSRYGIIPFLLWFFLGSIVCGSNST